MSYTEIYGFGKDGNAGGLEDVKNAWRGAMAIWGILEDKYLEPLPRPMWMSEEDYKERGYSRTCQPPSFSDNAPNPLKPVWDLWNDEKVSRTDKIVLGTTFDRAIVMRANIEETAKAFEEFEGETSLKEQAKILHEALEDEDNIAIGWNQTSVCGDTWSNYNYDEEKEESIPYNLYKQTDHFDMFEELNQMAR